MQNPALLNAYAECGARIECHMRQAGKMGNLTDRCTLVYLLKNYVKLGPIIKLIILPQGPSYGYLSTVNNTIYLINRSLGRALVFNDSICGTIQCGNLEKIVEFNGYPAAQLFNGDIVNFNGDILQKHQFRSCQLTWGGMSINFKGVEYRIKHDANEYRNISYQAEFIITTFYLDYIVYYDIYDISKLDPRVQNQPVIEFRMPKQRSVISYPQLLAANGLLYATTNNYIIVISVVDCCILWEISPVSIFGITWIKAPWTNTIDLRVKANGSLVVIGETRAVYEIQM